MPVSAAAAVPSPRVAADSFRVKASCVASSATAMRSTLSKYARRSRSCWSCDGSSRASFDLARHQERFVVPFARIAFVAGQTFERSRPRLAPQHMPRSPHRVERARSHRRTDRGDPNDRPGERRRCASCWPTSSAMVPPILRTYPAVDGRPLTRTLERPPFGFIFANDAGFFPGIQLEAIGLESAPAANRPARNENRNRRAARTASHRVGAARAPSAKSRAPSTIVLPEPVSPVENRRTFANSSRRADQSVVSQFRAASHLEALGFVNDGDP